MVIIKAKIFNTLCFTYSDGQRHAALLPPPWGCRSGARLCQGCDGLSHQSLFPRNCTLRSGTAVPPKVSPDSGVMGKKEREREKGRAVERKDIKRLKEGKERMVEHEGYFCVQDSKKVRQGE